MIQQLDLYICIYKCSQYPVWLKADYDESGRTFFSIAIFFLLLYTLSLIFPLFSHRIPFYIVQTFFSKWHWFFIRLWIIHFQLFFFFSLSPSLLTKEKFSRSISVYISVDQMWYYYGIKRRRWKKCQLFFIRFWHKHKKGFFSLNYRVERINFPI